MHLEVRCPDSNTPIRLELKGQVRGELPEYFNLICPHDGTQHWFHRRSVYAVADVNPTVGLTALGLFIGMFGGGAGAAVGSLLGAAAGLWSRRQDEEAAARFNQSRP